MMPQERMTAAEYRATAGKPRRNKYGAVPDYRCGECNSAHVLRFDSKAEARRWDKLCEMQKLGLIKDLKRQVPFKIAVDGAGIATYLLDFSYRDDEGNVRYEDVKGGKATQTPLSKLKIKLVEAQHGIKVEIVQ